MTQGNQGRSSGQAPGGKNRSRDHGGRLLLGPALLVACYYLQDPSPQVTAHSEMGLPTSISNQEEAPHTGLPTGQPGRGIFTMEAPSSRGPLACIELT